MISPEDEDDEQLGDGQIKVLIDTIPTRIGYVALKTRETSSCWTRSRVRYGTGTSRRYGI